MKFDYGEEVVLVTSAPGGGLIRRPCCIVGITAVETEEQAKEYCAPPGTILYTVEFGDGSDRFVQGSEIEHMR